MEEKNLMGLFALVFFGLLHLGVKAATITTI